MKNSMLFICVVIFLITALHAAIIEGEIVNALSGAPVSDATVTLKPGNRTAKSDILGGFIIDNVVPGRYSLFCEAVGYCPVELQKIDIRKNRHEKKMFKIPLDPVSYNTEIVVTAPTLELRFKDIMEIEVDAGTLKREAGSLEDPVRKIQTLPGVVPENDFSSVLYVRGGSADETMLVLDGSYLLNPYHLGGAFTVYFEDLIDKVDFFTGGFPPRYGNALSGVLDVSYRSGDFRKYHAMIDLSPITIKTILEGPLIRDRISFMGAFRRSYYDFIIRAINEDDDIAAPYFGDGFAKLTWLAPSRKLSLEYLQGQDGLERFTLDSPLENPNAEPGTFFYINKNRIINLSWEEWISPKWNVNGSLTYTFTQTRADLTGTEPAQADADVEFFMSDLETSRETETLCFSTGFQAGRAMVELNSYLIDFRTQIPGSRKTGNENTRKTDIDFNTPFEFESLWSELKWTPENTQDSQLALGVRCDRWDATDQWTFSPRINAQLSLSERFRLRSGWGIFFQFPYDVLQTADGFGNPDLQSERAMHFIVGCELDPADILRIRIDGFYKQYDNLIVNHDTEAAAYEAILNGKPFINAGKGHASGVELFAQLFPWKRINGWITYCYTTSRRYNPLHREVSKYYYPLQDQRHTFHLLLDVSPWENWVFSSRFTYSSGKPETPIIGWNLELDRDPPHYPIWVAQYGRLNSARLEPYARLDLKAQWIKQLPSGELTIYLDMINLTDRQNLYVYGYNTGNPPKLKPQKERINNLPFLPILGATYRF
ncbi:TonB-dependent receptor [bacterium]|nr:TonB-dependent receptor [candidate division CSSED10-310 bacterium]